MSVTVRIPEALRRTTGGKSQVTADGDTIAEVLEDLDVRFGGFRSWACGAEGVLRPYANIFINRQDARLHGGLSAPVALGDCISIVAGVSGGSVMRRQLYLTFPKKLIKEPIIFRIGHEFNVVTNVKGASVSNNVGFVALEIEGEPEEIERTVQWLEEMGVMIEPLKNDNG